MRNWISALRPYRFIGVILMLLQLIPLTTQAQPPIVYGVFFYSPTCPHCHEVITNHWPAIQSEFGSQLRVLFIDVTTSDGSQIMSTAIRAMKINSNAVPMLIIGNDVFVGSVDIPQRAPDLVRSKLSRGGQGYPPIPGIDAIFEAALAQSDLTSDSLAQKSFLDDPANVVAVVVLVALVVAVLKVMNGGWQLIVNKSQTALQTLNGLLGRRMTLLGAFTGLALTGSLILGSLQDAAAFLIAGAAFLMFAALSVHLFRTASLQSLSAWLTPMMMLAGLLVAGYLTYVEMSLTEASCGLVGNCNLVQQSPYARILGIPVGIIGILGYIVMLSLWLISRYQPQRYMTLILFTVVSLGVLFSIYLTFLEPFLIGASCVWCLTSAVIMGLLLWMMSPLAWDAMQILRTPAKRVNKAI